MWNVKMRARREEEEEPAGERGNGFTRKAFGSFRRRRLNGERQLDKGMIHMERKKNDCNRYI